MTLPYEKLTQILGIEASDYPAEHETTPEFMNGKFNELLENDKELIKQINVLESLAYTSKTDYFTQGETVLDFATKNSNSTKFVISGVTPSDLPISCEGWVSVESEIPSSARKRVVFKPYLQGRYEYYRELFNGEWRSEWKEIPSIDTVSRNKVLTTLEEANNPNLESGIYSCEGGGVAVTFKEGIESHYYVLIVNQHRINMGYGVQIAIPYDNGWQRGIYYRVCAAGTWGNWIELGENKIQRLTLLEGLTQGQWCSNIVNKVGNTLTFRLNFFLPSNWSSGRVIFYLPEGMRPTEVIHMLDDQNLVSIDITQSGACVLYGGVAGQQYVFNKSTVI